MKWLAAAGAALPALVLAAWCFAVTTGDLRNEPVWPPQSATLPEAVAMRNAGEVARQLGLGADPLAPAPVRAGLLGDEARHLSALEAAVIRADTLMWRQLLTTGALVDSSTLDVLRCWEARWPNAAMHQLLSEQSEAPWPTCPT